MWPKLRYFLEKNCKNRRSIGGALKILADPQPPESNGVLGYSATFYRRKLMQLSVGARF